MKASCQFRLCVLFVACLTIAPDILANPPKSMASENKIRNYYETAGKYFRQGDRTTAWQHLEKALRLIGAEGPKTYYPKIYNLMGVIKRNFHQSNEADRLLKTGLSYARYFRDSVQMASILNNLGLNSLDEGLYEQALIYHLESWKINDRLSDSKGAIQSSTSIGNIYYFQNNTDQALIYYSQALALSKKMKDFFQIGILQNNIGIIYLKEKQLGNALVNFKESLKTTRAIHDEEGIADAQLGLAQVYLQTNKLSDAKLLAQNALKIHQKFQNRKREAEICEVFGAIFEKEKNYALSKSYYLEQLKLAEKINNKEIIRNAYKNLSNVFSLLNDYKSAWHYEILCQKMNDFLVNQESVRVIADKEAVFQSEKKQRENEILSKKNKIQELYLTRNRYVIIGLLIAASISILIAYLLVRNNKIREQRKKSELRLQLLLSQMNPHFIFNSMVSIQKYIYHEEPEKAANHLSSIVQLMRFILENSTKDFIPLSTELEIIKNYLSLQQNRYSDAFSYQIICPEDIDSDFIQIPPMMLQPVIENAIEHGIIPLTNRKGFISVEVQVTNKMLIITIQDNGVGQKLKESLTKTNKLHLGISTRIIQERLQLLNAKNKRKSSFLIEELSEGTRVKFSFPLFTSIEHGKDTNHFS